MERSKNIVVIPAYNEQDTIAAVVKSLLPFSDVVVVSDNSSDRTGELALAAGAQVVTHEVNTGYEGAIESGFKFAKQNKYHFVVTFDADGQHDPTLARRFFERLDSGSCELILGVRPKKARVSEVIMGWYFRLRFGIKDILCGLKGYRIELYEAHGSFDKAVTIGASLILFAAKRKTPFTQIPVPIYERNGPSRFGQTLKGNLKILRALARLIKLDATT